MALRTEELAAPSPAFALPPELEANEPPEARGRSREDVRLLVTQGPLGTPTHARFEQLPNFLKSGDLVVLNASATIPSSLQGTTRAGHSFRISVSTRISARECVVEPRDYLPERREIVELDAGAVIRFIEPYERSRRLWRAKLSGTGDVIEYLHRFGLPIAYRHVRGSWPLETYQNSYAREAGSAEMPSAGRPLTNAMLARLRTAGVGIAMVVLHTGVSSPERDEPPYPERVRVPMETVDRITRVRANRGRVVAVGTTVVRALESAVNEAGKLAPVRGWTDLVITGRRGLQVVDAMLTGFHEPRSTHLAMLEALAGKHHVGNAYASALEGRYLWHEFGDSHLLLP